MAGANSADWIALDWGTSNVRAWAMGADGRPLASAESDQGMGSLLPDQFEAALLALVEGWLTPDRTMPVLACGMVGARQGWVEASYNAVPCRPVSTELTRAPTQDGRIAVWIIGGLGQSAPPEVMRGEETQIAGLIASRPDFAGTVCLPGTHTKWAGVSRGSVENFATAMTGEVFGLLSAKSVLRHSVGEGWSEEAFDQGLTLGLENPLGVTSQLFGLRAEHLLHGLEPGAARARLSGMLIGQEVAAMRKWWDARPVFIIGASRLARLYEKALARVGVRAETAPAEEMTLTGLSAARKLVETNA